MRKNKKGYIFILCMMLIVTLLCLGDDRNCKVAHISIDDVNECLVDLRNDSGKYNNVFEHPFFKKLKYWHNLYDCKFTLYIYYKSDEFEISQVPEKFRSDFFNSSSWLKLGFHAIQPTFSQQQTDSLEVFKQAFMEVNRNIRRFASSKSVSNVLRLHYYYANPAIIRFLKEQGVKLLLTTNDDNRISYSLPVEDNVELVKRGYLYKDSLFYVRTSYRLENMTFLPISPRDTVVLFTHEWALNRKNRFKMEACLGWLKLKGYKYVFFE